MQKEVEARRARFEKAGMYSHAIHGLYEAPEARKGGKGKNPAYGVELTNPDKMNRFVLSAVQANLYSALNSETSTVTGARKVYQEQDRRLFGTTKSGAARYRMTDEERREFWAIYDEYMKTADSAKYLTIQYNLADLVANRKGRVTFADFGELKESLDRSLGRVVDSTPDNWEGRVGVHRGRRI